jgi:hypothetical protein
MNKRRAGEAVLPDGFASEEARGWAVNAEPWEPMPGMIKRQCLQCRYWFASNAETGLCPDTQELRAASPPTETSGIDLTREPSLIPGTAAQRRGCASGFASRAKVASLQGTRAPFRLQPLLPLAIILPHTAPLAPALPTRPASRHGQTSAPTRNIDKKQAIAPAGGWRQKSLATGARTGAGAN